MNAVHLASVGLILLCAAVGCAQTPIMSPDAKPEKISTDFIFTEGPAADNEGNVYFTDQPNDRILKWTHRRQVLDFMKPCGRSNGLCFDSDGNLIACADEKNELWSIDLATQEARRCW